MNALHPYRKFFYRDIKLHNVLIDSDLRAYICDFGASIAKDKFEYTGQPTCVTTVPHVAPELWISDAYSTKSDVFAFGATLYQINTGGFYYSLPCSTWETRNQNNEKPTYSDNYNSFFKALCCKNFE